MERNSTNEVHLQFLSEREGGADLNKHPFKNLYHKTYNFVV